MGLTLEDGGDEDDAIEGVDELNEDPTHLEQVVPEVVDYAMDDEPEEFFPIIRTECEKPLPELLPEKNASVEANIPGLQHVSELAVYLADLRSVEGVCLTDGQVNDIVSLWNQLNPFDKQRIKYSERFQTTALQGKFKAPRSSVAPGVESTKRRFIGEHGAPAQFPDCSRLVEALCVLLCKNNPSPIKKGKKTISRWNIVLYQYRHIRELVMTSSLTELTNLALPELNQTGIMQWHNKKFKKMEQNVLAQGIAKFPAESVCKVVLPAATPLKTPSWVEPVTQHVFHTPANTAGQGKLPHRIAPIPAAVGSAATSSQFVHYISQPQLNFRPIVPQDIISNIPQKQVSQSVLYKRRQLAALGDDAPMRRKYQRKKEFDRCKKCGNLKTPESGHARCSGYNYCPAVEVTTVEMWKVGIKAKLKNK